MKKLPIIIVLIVFLALFATADFYLNRLDIKPILNLRDSLVEETVAETETEPTPPAIDSQFRLNEIIEGYQIISQVQASQIFEKIDLSNIRNLKIVRHQLEKNTNFPLFLYEIQGPKDQGSLTYLNIKLQFIAQTNARTETLNETGEYGYNSFFFNNKNQENTAYLLTQIGNNLYGFQYSKADTEAFNSIKAMIEQFMSRLITSQIKLIG